MKQKLPLTFGLLFILSLVAAWVFRPQPLGESDSPPSAASEVATHLPKAAPVPRPEPETPAATATPQAAPTDSLPPDDALDALEQQALAAIPSGELKSGILQLNAAARARALTKLRRIEIPLEDFGSLRVASDGTLYYVNDVPPPSVGDPQSEASLRPDEVTQSAAIPAPGDSVAAAVPIATPPARSSRPNSTNVIYLDFNGHTITGTGWNGSVATYVALPYDTDGSPTSFSDDEQSDIIEIWERVAEDYSPFDVNVTTVEPSVFTSTTARAMITKSVDANGQSMPSHTAGGVAKLDVFGESNFATYNSPSFVYYNNFSGNEANIAEAVAHEVGHNMGLTHDGQTGVEYYSGHGTGNTSWGPIMGTGYGRNVSQWSQGEYLLANNTQDDFLVMQTKMRYRDEDPGATTGTAAALSVNGSVVSDAGVISQGGSVTPDIDLYSFSTASGTVSLAVNSYRVSTGTHGGNADLKLELLDSSGSVVASHDPAGDTNASLSYAASAGTYYVRVSPVGDGTPLANPASGYTSYGSAGQYTLTGTIIASAPSITSATTASTDAGALFSYTIVGTNAPSSYDAIGLPSGLTVDTDTGIISGRATATGSFPVAISATNSLGTDSTTLTLTVNSATPAITDQTVNRTVVAPGESPTLSVTALSANGSPTYQWQRNGRNITGATSASLELSSVSRSDGGYYRVLVTNSIGTTRSSAMFLLVAPTSTQVLMWGGNIEGQSTVPDGLGTTAQISLGYEFTTALLRDGSLAAWGSDSSGQATAPSDITDAVQVKAGNFHALALRANGTVLGWGNSAYDQDVPPSDLTDVVAIAAGGNHSLALKNDGTVVAWGRDNQGQATVPGGLSDVVAIAAGNEFSLAVKSDGSVVGWGLNTKAQITVSASATATIDVSAGREFSLSLQSDGSVVSWGDNGFQQRTLPSGLSAFASVVAGSYHTVGLNPDGTVAAWGYNAELQRNVPEGLGQVFDIGAGRYHSAAVRDDSGDIAPSISSHPATQTVVEGTAVTLTVVASGGTSVLTYQWRKGGVDISGATSASLELSNPVAADSGDYDVVVTNQLGSATSNVATLTVSGLPVINSQSAARIMMTPGASLALSVNVTGTGTVAYQWYHNGLAISGATTNAHAKSGFGLTDAGAYQVIITDDVGTRRSALMFALYSPAGSEVYGWGLNTSGQTTIPSGLDKAIAVTTGTSHSLALKADGTVVAWGSNNQEETDVPADLTDVVKIAAGDNVSFALKSDGTIVAWGRPGFTLSNPPSTLTNVIDIACYGFFGLALTADGTVAGWGDNSSQQQNNPSELGTPFAIGAGSSTSYAINTAGTILGWGYGGNGETSPPAASALWRAVSGGGFHALGLKRDGTVAGWGFGGYATPPSGLSGIVAIGAGYRHSMALSSSGLITTWGGNTDGERDVPSGLADVFAIAAGNKFSLAIKEIGVATAPTITLQPTDETANEGASVSFTTAAIGFPAPTYQWRKDTIAISGATGTTYTIAAASAAAAGSYDVVATNASGSATSDSATLTVRLLPSISSHPQSQTVTVGTSVTLTVAATSDPSASYQWRKDGQNIDGAVGSSLALGAVNLGNAGDYDVVVTNVAGSVTSSTATVTVQSAPAFSAQPQTQTVVAGANVTFSVTASGSPAPSYQWRKDGTPIDGATEASLQLNTVSAAAAGSYDVVVTNIVDSITSDAALLTVQFAPIFSNSPQSQTVNSGANVVLSAVVSGLPTPTLQWRKDGQAIDGATGTSLDLGAVSSGANGAYDVVATNTVGSSTSNAATVRVLFGPSIDTHPASQTVTAGTSVTFSVSATGDPAPSYQWRKDTVAISGANSSSFTLSNPVLADAAAYDVVVSNSVSSVTSAAATLTVQTVPAFTTPPQTQTVNSGDSVVLTVAVTGVPTPTLQWRKDAQAIDGATGTSLDLGAVSPSNNGDYDVVATNAAGTVTSSPATLAVVFGPSIDTQPVSQIVTAGGSVTFSVEASGDPTPTYQWRKNGSDISGATSTTYTIASTTLADAADYDIVVTNSVNSATSNAATLTVQTAPTIATQPQTQTVNSGDNVTLTVVVTGVPTPTLQWRKDGQAIDGATSSSLDLGAVSPGANGDYDVVATNVIGTATSEVATLTVQFGPAITTQPIDQTVNAGTSVTFSVTATGDPAPTYQWRKDGTPIDGATSASHTLASPNAADAAAYDVVVTNSVSSITSSAATLTVHTAPAFTSSPQSQTVNSGDSVVLTAAVTGIPTPTLQWRKDGQAIDGATGPSLDLGVVSPGANGVYDVIATNSVTSTTSATATLTVQFSPSITTPPASQTVTAGTSVTFVVSVTGDPAPTYQWRKDGTDITGATSSSYTLVSPAPADAADYDVVVTNVVGSVTSATATLTVNVAPAISTPPQAQTLTVGDNATFTVVASGHPAPTYQWRKDSTPVTGATNASLDLGAISLDDAGAYDVVVTNSVGSITSAPAILTVQSAPAVTTPPQSQTANAGTSVTFTVAVSGVPTPTLQWRKNGADIDGATGPSLLLSNLTTADAADYDVVVINAVSSVTSAAATLTVNTAPVISTQPQSQTVTTGTQVTLTVVATGNPTPAYQWRKNGTAITGATASTLNLGTVALADEGNYDVLVTNSVDTVTSSVATVVVQAAPEITTQPVPQTVLVGSDVTFTVVASGKPTPTYQWSRDGETLSGATSSSLSLGSATTSLLGNYTVVVTNDVGSVTSYVASLSIIDVSGTHTSRGYIPDGTVVVENTITYTGTLTKLVWSVIPPAAIGGESWTFNRNDGTAADTAPSTGDTDLLEWTWNTVPASPISFSYTLGIPATTTGSHNLTAMVEVTSGAGTLQRVATADPLVLTEAASFHTADTNDDFKINLSELLRVIELYNTRLGTTRTGRYKVDAGTTDGFAPDPTEGTTQTSFHAADTNQDSKLSLSELLRVIELYNTRSGTTRTGEYHIDASTPDGFAAGPAS